MVESQADRDTASIRTNGMPGIFSIQNDPQMANQPSEAAKQQQIALPLRRNLPYRAPSW